MTPAVPTRCTRRTLVAGLVGLGFALSPRDAFAGTYLDQIGVLVREAKSEMDYLENRLNDKDLAELIHAMTIARVAAARDMLVPKEVAEAHPHMLLMLENCERAADAAVVKATDKFIVYQHRSRDEEQIFRSIMRQLGFPLEDEKKK
ncbi:MAG TPA: hypothetical protein VH142_14545 [Polyangiaceae bacterium]|jgi:hypothetical protein|nr:hypothetical protein [Polyangiaceae bacterium]